MKVFLSIVGGILSILLLAFGLQAFGLFNLKFYGVKNENAHREIFEQTKSFQHGIVTDLYDLKVEYSRAETQTQRDALRDVVYHRISGFDTSKLPSDLQNFINQL